MGVDYTGNYGIGVRLKFSELTDNSEDIELLDDLMEDNEDYYWFEVGESMYCGGKNEIYFCIDEPFRDGLDIAEKANNLYKFLKDNNLEFEGTVDVVGGLLVD